jgi:hypothetical protein
MEEVVETWTRLCHMPMAAYKEVIGIQRGEVTYNVILRRVRAAHNCCGKSITITDSGGVTVAVVIQHAMLTHQYPFKDEAQPTLFKDPVRTAL